MNIQSAADLAAALRSQALASRDLYAAWERRQPVLAPTKGKEPATDFTRQIPWLQESFPLAADFAAHALEKEEFLLVCDCARETLRQWPDGKLSPAERVQRVRLRMHYAAAQARLGYTLDARKQLEPCAEDDFPTPLDAALRAEILVQLGNVLREESTCQPLRAARNQIAAQALNFYLRALEIDPDRLETLALAAAAGLVISSPGTAIRARAEAHARQALEPTPAQALGAGPYRLAYFRGVALAVLGRPEEAQLAFGELAGLDGATASHLANARHWARTLAESLGQPADLFDDAFPPLQLIVFSGRLPDPPELPAGRPPRFPASAINAARATLRNELAAARAAVGLASAAAGSDLLFVEAMLARGGAVHLVLPWGEEEFRRTSVAPYDPPGRPPFWQPLYDRALAKATTVRTIGESYRPEGAVGNEYTMEVTAGLALHSARALRLDVQPMALIDRSANHRSGGTESFIEFWRQPLGSDPKVGDTKVLYLPPAPAGAAAPAAPTPPEVTRCERVTFRQEVKTMLFADIVGYSKISEAAIPQFVGVFLEAVSRLTSESLHAPRSVNTWGDAIYAVFDFAPDAGCYAMELIQLIRDRQEEWREQGLFWKDPHDPAAKNLLNIRVGLHTGPVFMHYNPVVRHLGFTGVHVSRAARIEPVTPHGEVFASEEFTALAELDRALRRQDDHPQPGADGAALSFVCEYAGSMALAKGYPGWHRLYRVAPHRVFALEKLAQVIHEDYCAVETRCGNAAANASVRPWAELPEDLRDSNRAQAADVPKKLEIMGYELAPSFGLPPSSILLTREQVEILAVREHDRWMEEKLRVGWKPGQERDKANKIHECLVPWEDLSEENKEKDRVPVRNVPRLVEEAGFRVRKIVRAG